MSRKPPPNEVWEPLSALAERRGVSRQAMSQHVARLEAQGMVTTRAGEGRRKLVNVAEYEAAAAQTVDGVRQLNGTTAKRRQTEKPVKSARSASRQPLESSTSALVTEQARRANISADLLDLRLQEQLGRLVPLRDVEAAMCRCATAMVRRINEIPNRADELAAAVAQEGAIGARRKLKEIGQDLRAALAAEMRVLAAEGNAAAGIAAASTALEKRVEALA